MDKKAEVARLVDSFVASLAPIILRYRNMEGENVVERFAERVETERERYKRKFESMRTNSDFAGMSDVISEVEKQIDGLADAELSRARADHRVEFDTLTKAMRDTHEAMSNAADKLEGK